MTTTTARHTGTPVLGAVLRAPWSSTGWLATIHLVVGFPFHVAGFVAIFTLMVLTVSLVVTAVLAVITLMVLMYLSRAFTAIERSRFAGVLGVDIPRVPVRPRGTGSWLDWMVRSALSASGWRQYAYHIARIATGTFYFAVITTMWAGSAVGTIAFTYGWWLPEDGWHGWDMSAPGILAVFTAIGLALLFAVPWVARVFAMLDVRMALALLGPTRSEELSARVESLTESRAGVVDAADAERRRIERDLHDGTQQRLVSLAISLGVARAKMANAPVEERVAIERAHEESKQALAELRDFVRGLHPAVLDDRGLDAALSGIAARAPVPVRLTVRVPERPTPTIEAIAYFVVSEALTNVAKHANATGVEVDVERAGDRLRVRVRDNGRGGAEAERGSGLRGLERRVQSVDGEIRVDSPVGGPTVVEAVLPCE